MRKPKGEYAIQTVVNAMRLLEAFRDEEELGVTDLARRLELHKNNVFRLLATLEQQSYIEQSGDNERYRLGVKALELGQSFQRSRSLLVRARPVLAELASKSGETVHLAVLRGWEVVHLDGLQSKQIVSTGLRLGMRLPLHCTALGKVLIGCAPLQVAEAFEHEVLAACAPRGFTPATMTASAALSEHLEQVGAQGFALDRGEYEAGLHCAAAPVIDGDGELIAALSISAPSYRVGPERLRDETAPAVVDAARRLSHDLGHAA